MSGVYKTLAIIQNKDFSTTIVVDCSIVLSNTFDWKLGYYVLIGLIGDAVFSD